MRRRGIFRCLAAERRLSLDVALVSTATGMGVQGRAGRAATKFSDLQPATAQLRQDRPTPTRRLVDVPRFSFRGSGRELARSQVRVISRIIYSAFSDY